MTRALVLSLALALGSLGLAAPALACGGYGRIDPERTQVSELAWRLASARLDDALLRDAWVHRLEIDHDRATVEIAARGAVRLRMELVRSDAGWTLSRASRVHARLA